MSQFSLSTRLTLLAFLTSSSVYLLIKSRLLRKLPLLLLAPSLPAADGDPNPGPKSNPKVFAFSQTGTSLSLARCLLDRLPSSRLVDPSSYEPDDFLSEALVVFVTSTWEDGGPPEGSRFLFEYIEWASDFRMGRVLEGKCRFAVFGVGSGGYGEKKFNKVGKDLRRWLKELGAEEVVELGVGDVDEGMPMGWRTGICRLGCWREGMGMKKAGTRMRIFRMRLELLTWTMWRGSGCPQGEIGREIVTEGKVMGRRRWLLL